MRTLRAGFFGGDFELQKVVGGEKVTHCRCLFICGNGLADLNPCHMCLSPTEFQNLIPSFQKWVKYLEYKVTFFSKWLAVLYHLLLLDEEPGLHLAHLVLVC